MGDSVSLLISSHNICICGLGSSVGLATDYGLDGPGSSPGSNPSGDEIFHLSRLALGPTQPPLQCVPGLSWGVKCGRGVMMTTHPLLVSWSSRPHWACNRITLPLPLPLHTIFA